MSPLQTRLADLPLVAILRGLAPATALDVGRALLDAGFRALEVPLNSPDPFESIRILANAFRDDALVGAGTVLEPSAVDQVQAAGGELIVMPHADQRVIEKAKAAGLRCVPGVATPTEAFAALAAGADALKLFPAEALPPPVLRAWRAVLPREVWLLPVGGIAPASMPPYLDAGANGFGLGSALFKPDMTIEAVAAHACDFANAYRGWAG